MYTRVIGATNPPLAISLEPGQPLRFFTEGGREISREEGERILMEQSKPDMKRATSDFASDFGPYDDPFGDRSRFNTWLDSAAIAFEIAELSQYFEMRTGRRPTHLLLGDSRLRALRAAEPDEVRSGQFNGMQIRRSDRPLDCYVLCKVNGVVFQCSRNDPRIASDGLELPGEPTPAAPSAQSRSRR